MFINSVQNIQTLTSDKKLKQALPSRSVYSLERSPISDRVSFGSLNQNLLSESISKAAETNSKTFFSLFDKIVEETGFHSKKRIKQPFSIRAKIANNKPLDDLLGGMGVGSGQSNASNLFVQKFLNTIKNKAIEVKTINNCGTKNTPGYINSQDIAKIKEQLPNVKINTGEKAVRPDGYPTAYIKGISEGIPFEIQYKGYKINQITKSAHLIYDILRNKEVPAGAEKLKTIIKNLSPSQQKSYYEYRIKYFETGRLEEINGKKMNYPPIPDDLPKELSYESVDKLCDKIGYV